MATKKSSARRMSEAEIDRIIEMKLDRQHTRAIAAELDCAPNTVTHHWHAWLEATSEERREQLERQRSQTIRRLEHVAATARRELANPELSPDHRVKFLNAERLALSDLARVAGHVSPQRIEVGGGLNLPSEDEARAILAQIDSLEES